MKYDLSGLIDFRKTQNLLDGFCAAVGISAALIDLDGQVLIGTRWKRLCTDFHRVHPVTSQRCTASDTILANRLKQGEKYSIYSCRNGLMDAATPITLEGNHVANMFVGQFFLDRPDMDFFMNQAARYGFDPSDYLAAVKEIPIVSGKNLNSVLEFLTGFAEMMADVGLRCLRELNTYRELQKSEGRFRRLAENAKDIIYRISLPDGRYEYISPAVKDITGYESDSFLKDPLLIKNVVHPDWRSFIDTQKRKLLRGDIPEAYEFQIVDRSGEIKWMHQRSVLEFDAEGKPSAIEGIVTDITELRRNEEERIKLEGQLRQAQKMEAIGTLAGGIAHDFNNLLQIITGYTEILLLDRHEDDPDSQKLNLIRQSTRRAAQLIQQLLLFSRKADTERRPTDINRIVEEAISILERTLPKMIAIHFRADPELRAVNADRMQIEQVLLNLGSNAADAMPDGGNLRIETENMTLTPEDCENRPETTPGRYVLVTISDTGHGMDRDTLEHIFEPFFTTKGIGKGTGLGLASAYGIVKTHGGYITCHSRVGQGATFRIFLPAGERHSADADVVIDSATAVGGEETILVVDDEPPVRDFVSRALRHFGYAVLTAPNGEDALKIYHGKKGDIDLVILDIGMPGMGGHQCLRELLQADPEARAIVASGYLINEEGKKAMDSGAVGYIGKPYHLTDLLHTVRQVLDNAN